MLHRKPGILPELLLKIMDQHLIHLNCMNMGSFRDKVLGQSAFSRTDFHHRSFREPASCGRYTFKYGSAGEKVLTEAPAQPFTSMRLLWKEIRTFAFTGCPKLRTGVNCVNSR
jgi:hypothetical protein